MKKYVIMTTIGFLLEKVTSGRLNSWKKWGTAIMKEDFDRLMRALRLNGTEYCDELQKIATEKTFEKGQRFSDTEKNDIMFLITGLLRGYVIDTKGEEITDCFIRRYAQACTMDLAVVGCKAEKVIHVESLEDTKLICFQVCDVIPMLSRAPELLFVVNRAMAQSYIDLWNHKMILYRTTAMERYEWFLKFYPGLINVVPHKYIASFLDMTPVTLSRLRKTMFREQLWIQ